VKGKYIEPDFRNLRERGNYTCDELTRWLGSEKHYSNDKKEVLFGLLADKDCRKAPVVFLSDLHFGFTAKGVGKRLFFQTPMAPGAKKKGEMKPLCGMKDELVVVYLSNFSINNNFSHFLHGLLRLFCALIDANWIHWDVTSKTFVQHANYTIWLDEYFRLDDHKTTWLKAMGGQLRQLGQAVTSKGSCITAGKALYGSGCVKLLPPEKWFGYPGCRAGEILPAFGHYMRQKFSAANAKELLLVDEHPAGKNDRLANAGLRVAFAVRDVSDVTGRRTISNLNQVQALLRKTQHVRTQTENITFEHLDVPSTVRYMAGVHIFVSVHGAGMTNMFFMNPGAAVVEIIPFPLCNCRSPDYFYGTGGYYHGSSVAQGIKHYHYCVPSQDIVWHEKPQDTRAGGRCSWKHLHAVESLVIDPTRFVSLMRNVERDLVVSGTIQLTVPIINMGPHANG